MDGKNLQRNILQSVSYCIENPLWRLSLQTHKIMGID
jgi:organic radical activating enzyme